jgi:pimeloyl-ACP methyl ester carboxylesterase
MSEPVLTGNLQKRSTFRSWTERQVSVTQGVLQYQSHKGLLRKDVAVECVSLQNSIVGEAPEMKRVASSKHSEFVFKLATQGADKIHYFAASSREEMNSWISAISQCGAHKEIPDVEEMVRGSAKSCPFTRIWVNTDDGMLSEAERLVFAECKTPMRQQMVAVGLGVEMNTWTTVDGDGKPPLVLMHGWGASSAFWYRTVDMLSAHYKLYIADWLGFGRSTSVIYEGRFCQEAEDYWLQPFEKWTMTLGLDTFALAGHSLGGYLCCKYAAAHPDKVRMLVLVSPGGTTTEYATVFHAEKNKTSAASDASGAVDDDAFGMHEGDVADDAVEHIGAHSDSDDGHKSGQEQGEPPRSTPPMPVTGSVAPPPRPRIAALSNPRVQSYVWNMSPSGLLRKLGPYGRKVAMRVLKQRWGDHTSPAFVLYTYHMFVREGGHPGENATRHVFKPIALPYHPLEECAGSLQMPSLWLFGATFALPQRNIFSNY